MSRIDRIILGSLAVTAAALAVIVAFATARMPEPQPANVVREPATTTTVVTPPPAPVVCVVDGTDTNWAARFGVPDSPRCA